MNRWQLRAIYCYSHDGRRVGIELDLSAVNLIVGISYSGKSALVEVIDYCLGAGQCHIPGLVREASSWVAVVWRKDKSEILVARRVPPLPQSSSVEVYYQTGAPVAVPEQAADLRGNTNADGALRQFEQALLMGDVTGETFTAREGVRISFRNAVPYLLQSDDVIVNKMTLLRGANDERRTSIADSIPYFLGAVDESTARAEAQLRQLRTQREREARRLEAIDRQTEQDRDSKLALYREAAQLNMMGAVAADLAPTELDAVLRRVAAWTRTRDAGVEIDQLPALQSRERELRQRYAVARRQLDAATALAESAGGFATATERQRQRLSVVSLFRTDSGRDTCPVCTAPVVDRTPNLDSVRTALSQLDAELNDVSRDRPKIDAFTTRLRADLTNLGQQLEEVRGQITAVVRESEAAADFDIDERRLRVAGRVSYFLETRDLARGTADRSRLEALDTEISNLEAVADPDAKAERLNALQLQVSAHATDFLRKLPFDKNYSNCHVSFDARRLAIRFVVGPRVMEMRDVGGDESYLSGHVAALLALHRVFADGNRPVPGLLVFDQLSRPFFPPDEQREMEVRGGDRVDLSRYFDVLFEEVAARGNLQVIVLEHAYFADDSRYTRAVRARWTELDRLIPSDWPRVTGTLALAPRDDGPKPSSGASSDKRRG